MAVLRLIPGLIRRKYFARARNSKKMAPNNTVGRQAASTKRLGGNMGYLNRFVDAGNTRERRVFSVFIAFVLALSFAGVPLFGETALAAQGNDTPEQVVAAAPEAETADATGIDSVEQPKETVLPADEGAVAAHGSAIAGCGHDAWAASDSRWVIEDSVYPTCTQPGVRAKVCPLCGEVAFEDEVAALGHNFEAMICVDDTEYGYCEDGCDSHGHRVVCESCDGEEAGGIIEEDHVYGDWEVVEEAAPGGLGLQQRLCLGCGHTQSAPVADSADDEPSTANPIDPNDPAASVEEPAIVDPADVPEGGSEAPDADEAAAAPGESDASGVPADEPDADFAADPTDSPVATDAPIETIEDDANPLAAAPDQGTHGIDTDLTDIIDGVNGLLQQVVAAPGHLIAFACEAADLLCSACNGPDADAPAASALGEWGGASCDRQSLMLQ